MILTPSIEAEISLVKPKSYGENRLNDHYRCQLAFRCQIINEGRSFDCLVWVPRVEGQPDLQETAIASIQLLGPLETLERFQEGDPFQLWAETHVATGKVTKVLNTSRKELQLEFTGSTSEYFRIWIVNLCLSLFTLGIFSAWAKVRNKRYFYSHTSLDGTPFQYLGQPLPILKGRVIAVILFATYFISEHFLLSALPYVLSLGLVLAPWAIIRASAFSLRCTAFRNITFNFEGAYGEAFKVTSGWGLLPAFIVCMIFGWWGIWWLKSVAIIAGLLAYPWWICKVKTFLVGNTRYGGQDGVLSAAATQFFEVYFRAACLLIVTAMVGEILLSSAARSSDLLFRVPIYAGYVLAYGYIRAHSRNLVWNGTTLGPLRFTSSLAGRTLGSYYLTNALAIMVSAGLLTPWAMIRTMKYRADNLRVFLLADADIFRGSDPTNVAAVGSEIGEIFGMDIDL